MNKLLSTISHCCMRAGDLAGFGAIESSAVHVGLRRVLGLAVLGVVLAIVGPFVGVPSAAGLVVLALAIAVQAGGLLLAAQMNEELATLLAMPATEPKPATPSVAVEPVTPPPLSAPVRPARKALQVLSRGEIDGRAYAVFMDGSIEIETIFGPRWFASVDLAHEFIGYRKGGSQTAAQIALAS